MTRRVPTYTAEQVRAAERPLLAAGVPLMRRAAAALADVVRVELTTPETVVTMTGVLEPVIRETPVALRPRVLVLVGSGDNGGDALYAAAHLSRVADVDALLVSERFHVTALATAVAAGVRRIDLPEADDAVRHYAIVVDGILGIGASSDPSLRGTAREAVTAILDDLRRGGRMPRVIAVDIPSGLHPDTGEADDAVLAASVTVTFGAVKAGLVTGRGAELAGEIVLVDIGLGPALDSVVPAGEATVSRIVTAPTD
jgi:hydroxyethylthiazole kinase-like uncharacterized protein yjeF